MKREIRCLFPLSVKEVGHKYGDLTIVGGDIDAPIAYLQGELTFSSVRAMAEHMVKACNSYDALHGVARSALLLTRFLEGVPLDFSLHEQVRNLQKQAEAALGPADCDTSSLTKETI